MKYRRKVTMAHLIHRIKNGYGIVFPSKGFPPYQFTKLVAGILGIGMGMAGLYIAVREGKLGYSRVPWTFEKNNSSEIVCYVAGLQNLGNNCFLNVILQALASCNSFYHFLQNILLAAEQGTEEKAERMPLAVALTLLLEELFIVRDERTVLNPQRVMRSLGLYVSNFKLTRQQDAAEALIHLLSSLEEELSQCHVPHSSSLVDISAIPSRIYIPKSEGQHELERWRQYFLGPFNGTMGSILTCRSCMSSLSMDFEFFRCLPLSPVLDKSADIMDACTVVDCLRHFTTPELVENYRCGRCWHMAALKYMSLNKEKDEEKLKVIAECVKLDSCDCKKLFLQEEITWTGFSRAAKRLIIASCPKILCLHLQRAFVNAHGELIKLQGHVSFPLILDLFPFMEAATTVEQETLGNIGMQRKQQQQHPLAIQSSHIIMPWEMPMPPSLYKVAIEDCFGEIPSRSEMVASDVNCPQACSIYKPLSTKKEQIMKSGGPRSSKCCLYCLSSAVEHYGRPGSGHYAVYRRVASEPDNRDSFGLSDNSQWLYISDSEVSSTSEASVLAAEATLLFYERIEAPL